METKIVFQTNIDRYKGKFYTRSFLNSNVVIPRVGDMIKLSYKDGRKEFTEKGYPDSLEVVKVTYDYDVEIIVITIELHYSSMDLKLMKASETHPYK